MSLSVFDMNCITPDRLYSSDCLIAFDSEEYNDIYLTLRS